MQSAVIAVAIASVATIGVVRSQPQDEGRQLEQRCDAGDLDACMELARRCVTGTEGFEKDTTRAVSLYERACNAGHADGCQYLGQAYQQGDIVPKDEMLAIQYFERSCEHESGSGCWYLGGTYARGRGVAEDNTRASAAYEQACDLGYELGCSYAVRLHQPVIGVLKDGTRWAALMEKHCDHPAAQGVPCLQLGLVYDIGMWVAKDTDHANDLFKKGCLYGNKEACALIRR